jgi:hypothetical protein
MLFACLLLFNCNVRELNMPAPREAVIAMIEAAMSNLVLPPRNQVEGHQSATPC